MAQLGARFHGMEEVVGSIPTRSTNLFLNVYAGFLHFSRFLNVMLTTPSHILIANRFESTGKVVAALGEPA